MIPLIETGEEFVGVGIVQSDALIRNRNGNHPFILFQLGPDLNLGSCRTEFQSIGEKIGNHDPEFCLVERKISDPIVRAENQIDTVFRKFFDEGVDNSFKPWIEYADLFETLKLP